MSNVNACLLSDHLKWQRLPSFLNWWKTNKQNCMTCGNHQILTHFRLDILHQLQLTKVVIIPAQLKLSSLSAAPVMPNKFFLQQHLFNKNPIKVWTFWETHKIWKNLPYGFDKSADLLSKRQNHKADFFKLCVVFKQSEL